MSSAATHEDDIQAREITIRSVLLGTLTTIVFSAANVFMGLRTGITFSTSIPAAVISMGCMSALGNAGLLENNMVQTQASAAGTLSNIILVLPAMVIVGAWDHFPFWPSMLVCLIGGWIGVLYSIPLRRTLIVESKLPFPEGVAAAEVLFAGQPDAGEEAVEGGLTILGVAAAFSALLEFGRTGVKLLAAEATATATFNHAIFRASTGFSMALVGVGYLVGIAASLSLLAGVFMSWGVLVPIITHAAPDSKGSISDFAVEIWTERVRLVGAGIIGVGALWSAISLSKPMAAGVRSAFAASKRIGAGEEQPSRSERDIPIIWVAAASGALALPLALLFAWFLQPHSPDLGMTVLAALAACAAIFVLGNDSQILKLGPGFALLITAVVVSISSIANDNLQDLKTGAMVNATPWRQQAVLLIGVLAGAIVIAPVLQLLYESCGFAGAAPTSTWNG